MVAKTQTVAQTQALADSLFVLGDYEQAVQFYQRVLFFSSDKGPVYLRLADSYFQAKQYKAAYLYYALAYSVLVDSLQRLEIDFKKVLCNLKLGNYALGLQDILQLPDNLPKKQNYRRNFYLASLYFGQKKYSLAETFFLQSFPDSASQSKKRIKKLFRSKALNNKRIKESYYLSLLVPGSGQIMAHEYGKAVNSFLLTGSLSLLTYYVAKIYSPADAFLSLFPWLYRYYLGGAFHAEKMNERQQAKQRNAIYNQILRIYVAFS